MNVQRFLQSWEGITAENRWLRLICLGLMILSIMMGYMLSQRPIVSNLIPYTLTQDAWVTSNKGSQSYKESWALFLSQLLGNVSPDNVDFISERIVPMLDPRIKNQYVELLEQQALQIKEDRVSIRFDTKYVEFEPTTNKVFVFGNAFESGASNDEKRKPRTYEFIINVQNYVPLVSSIESYTGNPRTQTLIEKINAKNEKDMK